MAAGDARATPLVAVVAKGLALSALFAPSKPTCHAAIVRYSNREESMASEPKQKADNVTLLLDDIKQQSENGDLGGFGKTITKCLAPPKAIHEIAESAVFWQCLKSLLENVSADSDHTVALALAEIGRLSAALKSKSDRLGPLASDLLKRRTPSHFSHGDADVTTFAAKGWVCSGHSVDLSVATCTAVHADAPKPLVSWLELAFSAGETSAVIEQLAGALVQHSHRNGNPRRAALLACSACSRRCGRYWMIKWNLTRAFRQR